MKTAEAAAFSRSFSAPISLGYENRSRQTGGQDSVQKTMPVGDPYCPEQQQREDTVVGECTRARKEQEGGEANKRWIDGWHP
jgi:hypothetical protein